MTTLNTLKLVSARQSALSNPVHQRRFKLARKLAEEIEVAKAASEGQVHTVTRSKMITNSEGVREATSTTRKVKEWFWTCEGGKVNVAVRYGSKVIELAKGKNAIELASSAELVPTLQLVRDAVIAGELDEAISSASEKLKKGFKR
ncbi:MAG: hypothetical protein IM328_06670 [Microcystis sp. M034S1]|nr:DUF6641 family protein [Microcystis sp. M034S1]MCA2909091.1 hypothetical protein [Microcystis sp. M034S1]